MAISFFPPNDVNILSAKWYRQPDIGLSVFYRESLTLFVLPILLFTLNGCTTTTSVSDAPLLINQVDVSEWITTAGQPSEVQLARIKRSDYELVVNLSPLSTPVSVPDEARIITDKGIDYVHIPVDVRAPNLGQFEVFSDKLNQYRGKNILVHCQINHRASVFTFMYQVVHEKTDPHTAYQYVTLIWVPAVQWLEFIDKVFTKYRIDFQP